jgi:hypothetical protein
MRICSSYGSMGLFSCECSEFSSNQEAELASEEVDWSKGFAACRLWWEMIKKVKEEGRGTVPRRDYYHSPQNAHSSSNSKTSKPAARRPTQQLHCARQTLRANPSQIRSYIFDFTIFNEDKLWEHREVLVLCCRISDIPL